MEVKVFRNRGEKLRKTLSKSGIIDKIYIPDDPEVTGKVGFGEGYPSKAIYKFLGYYERETNIAYNPSFSLNVDISVCKAYCHVNSGNKDRVWFNSETSQKYTDRAEKALNAFRRLLGVKHYFDFAIFIDRKYGRAKGLSESSAIAGASAWALARTLYRNEDISPEFVSILARLVSGSGSRTVYSEPALWISYPGIDPLDSFAVKVGIERPTFHFLTFPEDSAISTSDAHSSVPDSLFFGPWISNKYDWLESDSQNGFRFTTMLERATAESLYLHSLLYSVGLITNNTGSIQILQKFIEFRKKNKRIYLLQDTGPSIVLASPERGILAEFAEFSGRQGISTHAAPELSATPDNELLKRSLELFDSG